jgi:hypothetical protein
MVFALKQIASQHALKEMSLDSNKFSGPDTRMVCKKKIAPLYPPNVSGACRPSHLIDDTVSDFSDLFGLAKR